MQNYFLIKIQRQKIIAPVDLMGCYSMGKDYSGNIKKFHILLGLLFSSQTRDEITYQAFLNLKNLLKEITPENILKFPKNEIHKCISKIGYHNKKLEYLIEISRNIIKNNYPETLEDVLKLPGIGRKMAYLYLYYALDKNLGIAVDTHVHRVSNRIGLVKTKEPEKTREELEKIFDIEEYPIINNTLVGFGQTICLPVNPKCYNCIILKKCPSSILNKKLNR